MFFATILSSSTRRLSPTRVCSCNMSIIHSLLTATNFRNPFLRNLIPSIGLAFGIQAAVAVPSILGQTERFYDLSGSLTYLSCTALSLYLPILRARSAAALAGAPKPAWPTLSSAFNGSAGPYGFNWRQVFLSAAVSFWAARRKSHSVIAGVWTNHI